MLLGIGGMTFPSFLLFGIFLAAFLLGYRFSRPGSRKSYPVVWKLGLPLFIIGAAAEFVNLIHIGTVPLFVPSMRSRMVPVFTYLSFLIVPACIIKISDSLLNKKGREALGWLLAGTFLISLLGYRTEIFALLLGAFFSAYYIKGGAIRLKTAVKYGSVFALVFLLLNVAVFSFREAPLTSFMERFSFTTYVFSSIVDHMGISTFGYSGGLIHTSILSSLRIVPGPRIGPRTFISQLIGVPVGSTTPTIIGIPFVDFGMAGILLTGLLLGFLFGSGYKTLRRGSVDLLPIHALCMAFLILTIETGIADAIVLVYLIAYLLFLI